LLPSFFGNLKQQKMNKKQVVYQKTNEAKKWNNVAIHIHLTKMMHMDMDRYKHKGTTVWYKLP
jgi:hypothetical protein